MNSVDGSITSMDKNITVTFTSDSKDPNVFFDCRIHKQDFEPCKSDRYYHIPYSVYFSLVGSSPFTYTENDGVREGENIVRVRAQCLGQANNRPTTDFTIGKYMYMELVSQ